MQTNKLYYTHVIHFTKNEVTGFSSYWFAVLSQPKHTRNSNANVQFYKEPTNEITRVLNLASYAIYTK